MIKLAKRHFWVLVLVLQSFAAITAGLTAVGQKNVDSVPGSVKAGELNIGGMTINDAAGAIKKYYDEIDPKQSLVIEIGQITYKLDYSDFDARVDVDKTIEAIKNRIPMNGFETLFFDSDEDIVIKPVFTYNSEKLKACLEEIFSSFEKAPADESYKVDGDVLVYNPPSTGKKVDYSILIRQLENYLFTADTLSIDPDNAAFLVETPGESRYKEQFTKVVSKAQVEFDPGLKDKVPDSLSLLNGIVFEKGQEIDLGNLLDFSKFSGEVEKDLLNRIATGIFQSALKIDGINIISYLPSAHPVPYAEAGLEAVINGDDGNLVLKNETNGSLLLLADTSDNRMNFYFASNADIRSGILIVQKKDEVQPPVITSVNEKLGKNQTRVVSEGIPGFTAHVSRIIDDERQELFVNKYDPVSKVVETGERPVLAGDK